MIDDSGLTIADYEACLADQRRLVRDLDVALFGEAGAAKQASLCDLIEPARQLAAELTRLRSARNEAIEMCAKVAESEEELDGEMPDEFHLMPVEDVARAAVRATKKNIIRNIRSTRMLPMLDKDGFRMPVDTDGASPDVVLAELMHCASCWEPGARLLGNIRAEDIIRALRSRLSSVEPKSAEDEVLETLARNISNFIRGGYVGEAYFELERAMHDLDLLSPSVETKSGSEPVAWRDLHPKIAAEQFLAVDGVKLEGRFLHMNRTAMTAIWHMLLDLQTVAYGASPSPSVPVAMDYEKALERLQIVSIEIDDLYLSEAVDALSWLMRASPSPSVPEGWVMVPKEPTEAMLDAAYDDVGNVRVSELERDFYRDLYRAMLAHAPSPPSSEDS